MDSARQMLFTSAFAKSLNAPRRHWGLPDYRFPDAASLKAAPPMENPMSHELGTLEDLPADYVAALRARNLVPLWPSLRGVLPPKVPTRHTQPTHWAYARS